MTFSSASHQFLRELTEVHGPSFYVFWEERLSSNFHRLDSAFRGEYPRTEIAYSYKTNYVPAVCKTVHALGGLAEVVSAMEWEMASLYGVPPSMVIYNGIIARTRRYTQSRQGRIACCCSEPTQGM